MRDWASGARTLGRQGGFKRLAKNLKNSSSRVRIAPQLATAVPATAQPATRTRKTKNKRRDQLGRPSFSFPTRPLLGACLRPRGIEEPIVRHPNPSHANHTGFSLEAGFERVGEKKGDGQPTGQTCCVAKQRCLVCQGEWLACGRDRTGIEDKKPARRQKVGAANGGMVPHSGTTPCSHARDLLGRQG